MLYARYPECIVAGYRNIGTVPADSLVALLSPQCGGVVAFLYFYPKFPNISAVHIVEKRQAVGPSAL